MLTTLELNDIEEQEDVIEAGGSSHAVTWLMALGLAVLFLPLYLISGAIKESNQTLTNDLAEIAQQQTDLSQPGSTQQTLQDDLIKARQRLETLSAGKTNLIASHINWPAVMAVIGNNGYVHMDLLSLSQADNQIVLRGQAQAESIVMTYARMLEESGQFSKVIVQSISLKVLPTPTPPPTTQPVATTTLASPASVPTVVPQAQVVEFVILVECDSTGGSNE